MQNPRKSHIDSKEPMTRNFVKMPILEQPAKNNNCLFYSEEMLYGVPCSQRTYWNILLMEKYYKEIKLYSVPKVV